MTAIVYVFSAPHGVKVGVTRTSVERRRAGMEQTVGFPITVVAAFDCDPDKLYAVERQAHELLADSRTLGEWFSCTPEEAVTAVRAALAPISPVESLRSSPPTAAAPETLQAIEAVAASGVREELACLHVLGGRATSRQIASVLHGEPPGWGATLSIGRRMFGLQNRGYLVRWGNEWVLTDAARREIGVEAPL